MSRVSVNFKALAAYLFVVILVYLAGTYVAHFYFFLYVFLGVLPLYSVLQVVLAAATLECIQGLDSDEPSKGDTLHYRLWVTGKPFLTTEVEIRFLPVHSRLPYRIPELHLALFGRRFVEKTFDIHLLYRGTYTIGIDSIWITDALGWLSIARKGTQRSFAVHPRILPLVPPAAETRVHALSESGVNGIEQDLTMFEGLAGYREGEPIRYIAWKKYLTTGTPYLKRFGGSSEPAVTIYVDLRLPKGFPETSEIVPKTEDCSIEMVIGLVKGYLERGIRVTVRAAAEGLYTFSGATVADFRRFFAETDDLHFSARAPSPVRLSEADRSERAAESSVLFITHDVDDDLFETLSERSRSGERTAVFLNLTAMNESERERAGSYGRAAWAGGAGRFFVAHADTLPEDLASWSVSRG